MKRGSREYKWYGPAFPADCIRAWLYRKAPKWARKIPIIKQGKDVIEDWKAGTQDE